MAVALGGGKGVILGNAVIVAEAVAVRTRRVGVTVAAGAAAGLPAPVCAEAGAGKTGDETGTV